MNDSLKAELYAVVYSNDLLQSKFYQAWSAGTLSKKGLVDYAKDYGAFIGLLPLGWEVQNDEETAHEEEEHIEMWEKFADSLGTDVSGPNHPAVKKLCAQAHELFGDKVAALGALYAFEVQQPETSVSKLKGLRDNYASLNTDEEYFEAHCKNHHEAEKLLKRISTLSPADQTKAIDAAAKMSLALRQALDGLYEASGSKTHC